MSADGERLTLAERDALALEAYRAGENMERAARRLYLLSAHIAIAAARQAAERDGLDWDDVRAERERRKAA